MACRVNELKAATFNFHKFVAGSSSEDNARGSGVFRIPLQDEMCNPTVALWSPPSWKSLEHLQSKVP